MFVYCEMEKCDAGANPYVNITEMLKKNDCHEKNGKKGEKNE